MILNQTCVKKIDNVPPLTSVFAEVLYPKIIIFENQICVRILNLTSEIDEDNVYLFDSDIIDHVIFNNNAWIILKSGELLVLNIFKYAKVKVVYDSYVSYKIRKLAVNNSRLVIISESGERLSIMVTEEHLEEAFNKGLNELLTSLDKAQAVATHTEKYSSRRINIDIDTGKLIITCPTTGIVDSIATKSKLKYTTQWNDYVIISNEVEMCIIDKNFNCVSIFEGNDMNYFPLDANDNIFYYITWNKEEMAINYASLSSNEEHHSSNYSVILKANISSEETLKLKLKSLINEIILNKQQANQVLSQLQVLFNDIEDFELLIKSASMLCQLSLLYKPILYTLQKKIFACNETSFRNLIYDLINKTELLEYIYFKEGTSYSDFNVYEKSFVELCIAFLAKLDLDLASICWLKYSELFTTINTEDIINILNAIPYNVKIGALVIWFRNFVPPLLDQNPFYIDLFVKWTMDRVFILEQSSYWPKIGLKFLDVIINVLETSIKTICIRPISIDDLDVIKDHINYIMELKENYKINMLLSEFSSQSPSEIALIMLRRCYTEDLEEFIRKSLPSYASRHLLDLDDTLRSFVESEAASSGGGIDGQRLKILLNAFRSPSIKLECLLNVLKVLDVPWDTTVVTIANTAAALIYKDFTITDTDRILAQEIYKELNYAKIKVILKKYNFPLTCTDYTLVIHKIINSSKVDLSDLNILSSVLTTNTNYINTLYIDRCLRDCDTKLALDYFKGLCSRNKRILIKTIENKYEQIITDVNLNPLLERNYIDFLKGAMALNITKINYVESLYHLKNSYNIKINLNDINSYRNRINEIDFWKQKEKVTSSSGRGRCALNLVRTDLSNQSNLIYLLRRTCSRSDVRILVESLIMPYSRDKSNTPILSKFKNGVNSDLLLESYNILSEVVFICDEEHLHYLLTYLSILNALINTSLILKNLSVAWKFQYVYLPMSSTNALNDLIDFYTCDSVQKYVEADFTNILSKQDFVSFRIIADVINRSSFNKVTFNDNVRNKFTKRLLSKIVALQELDQILITYLLLSVKNDEPTEDMMWILELLREQSDSIPPNLMHYLSSSVIRRTFKLENILPGSTMSYPPQYVLKNKFNINLSEIALPENNEETWDVKILLFHILKQYPETPFDRLVELCKTLNVSPNDGFSLLLISLLSNWDLKYKIVEEELGNCKITTESKQIELLNKCVNIWQSIEEKEFLIDILNDFWKSGEVMIHGCLVLINPYYYEVYLCIYQLIFPTESKNLKDFYLLNFLKGYQRRSTPKQYEFELFSVKGSFPEIGYHRLPFHLFMRDDMWSNLKSEITLETYELWLPIVALLSLDGDLQTAKDMICSNAVKQTMTSRKRYEDNETKENEPWRLTSREEPLLRTAHRCVRHIANMEWAGACLFYVFQGCTRGADQVAAAQLCYQFSQRWASLQPGNRAVRQMERLHSTLSTRHALYKIDWACEELICLSTEPAQLINALYLHPNFVEKVTRHDINRAANEIADKNNINISSIRIQILENILNKVHKDSKNMLGLDTRALITAKYILRATCPKMGAIYLSRIAFEEESDFNKCKKMRALQCLMSVIEPDTAIKVTNRERSVLWASLLELFYVIHLERIDTPWVIATFTQNKTQALTQLLQIAAGNIECSKVAAELAYKFGNIEIIREIIPMLLKSSLFEEMIPLLLKVQHPPDNVIYSAWRAVILSPFQRADYPLTDRQKTKCLNALNLLPVCPVIKDEDLIEIWKNCVRCKCLGLGCLVLPYMTSETRRTLSELQKVDKRNLVISLKNLHSDTYLVSGAMFILENFKSKTYR